MNHNSCKPGQGSDRGQVTILLALSLLLLLLFAGSAVDFGNFYVAKARMSKAVDAACLTGMKNLAQGQATALTLATNSFNANYGTSSLDVGPPTLVISFTTNGAGNMMINVDATASIRTFFIGLVPQFQTFQVHNSAQATRGKLVMSLVLDRSGSMNNNGGAAALPPAVTSFIANFDDANDEVAMVSFASNATVDVAIGYNFKTPITNAADALQGNFSGGTFGPGGLTLGKAQNDSVPIVPGQNVTKVIVYFTDGGVHIVQDTLNCTSRWGPTLYNYGGHDSGSQVDFFDPASGTDWKNIDGNYGLDHNGNPAHQPTPDCTGVTKFTAQSDGNQKSFTRANVTAEAQYRALQTANAMRTEGMVVYSIGLGSSVDQTFLKEIANDPSSPTYNSAQPDGLAVFAPNCPSSQCTTELQQVFQTIASRILLRLTQ